MSFSGFEPVGIYSKLPIKDNIKYINIFYIKFLLLNVIHPVQFPLHEPYFDLTPIKVMHTKIILIYLYTQLYI